MAKGLLFWCPILTPMRPRQSGSHFPDGFFKCIFLNENVWISLKISLKFVPKVPINYIPALSQIMAWRRPGDKSLSEPMMFCLRTHICIILGQEGTSIKKYTCTSIISVPRYLHTRDQYHDHMVGCIEGRISSRQHIPSSSFLCKLAHAQALNSVENARCKNMMLVKLLIVRWWLLDGYILSEVRRCGILLYPANG